MRLKQPLWLFKTSTTTAVQDSKRLTKRSTGSTNLWHVKGLCKPRMEEVESVPSSPANHPDVEWVGRAMMTCKTQNEESWKIMKEPLSIFWIKTNLTLSPVSWPDGAQAETYMALHGTITLFRPCEISRQETSPKAAEAWNRFPFGKWPFAALSHKLLSRTHVRENIKTHWEKQEKKKRKRETHKEEKQS